MLGCLVAGILSHSGDHRAHSTRSGKQSEIVRSSQPGLFVCLFVSVKTRALCEWFGCLDGLYYLITYLEMPQVKTVPKFLVLN